MRFWPFRKRNRDETERQGSSLGGQTRCSLTGRDEAGRATDAANDFKSQNRRGGSGRGSYGLGAAAPREPAAPAESRRALDRWVLWRGLRRLRSQVLGPAHPLVLRRRDTATGAGAACSKPRPRSRGSRMVGFSHAAQRTRRRKKPNRTQASGNYRASLFVRNRAQREAHPTEPARECHAPKPHQAQASGNTARRTLRTNRAQRADPCAPRKVEPGALDLIFESEPDEVPRSRATPAPQNIDSVCIKPNLETSPQSNLTCGTALKPHLSQPADTSASRSRAPWTPQLLTRFA